LIVRKGGDGARGEASDAKPEHRWPSATPAPCPAIAPKHSKEKKETRRAQINTHATHCGGTGSGQVRKGWWLTRLLRRSSSASVVLSEGEPRMPCHSHAATPFTAPQAAHTRTE
jgi:hypothetical protein